MAKCQSELNIANHDGKWKEWLLKMNKVSWNFIEVGYGNFRPVRALLLIGSASWSYASVRDLLEER